MLTVFFEKFGLKMFQWCVRLKEVIENGKTRFKYSSC